jgi:hypothetical protein
LEGKSPGRKAHHRFDRRSPTARVLEWAFEDKPGEAKDIFLCLAGALAQGQGRRDGVERLIREAAGVAPYRPPFHQAECYSFTAPVSDET